MDIKKTKSNFYSKKTVDGRVERDFLLESTRNYRFTYTMSKHVVTDIDKRRPDLISLQYYEDSTYWYIIAQVNGIQDFDEDLKVGDVLKIPAQADIDRIIANAN